MSDNIPNIQSQVALVLGIAVAVERILEAFWIAVKYVLSQGCSFDFKDFDNKNHQTYLRFKKFKEISSVVMGVGLGIGMLNKMLAFS